MKTLALILLSLVILTFPAYGAMHKTPKQNKSTIKNYNLYVKQYNQRADSNLKINKQKRIWYQNSKAYRRNPGPSNPIYYTPAPPARP